MDPNRNYDFAFGGPGSSDDPCSQTYRGPRAFSEPETESESELVMSMRQRIKLFISLHSYSQLVLIAWDHTKETHKDYDDMVSET